VEILGEGNIERLKIEYPTRWGFRIIGRDKSLLENAIKDVMGEKSYLSHFSNYSRNRKFCSYNVGCEVESKMEKDEIFRAFSEHKDVDMVI
jgi:putative lipoic acid-binding regulatory protein